MNASMLMEYSQFAQMTMTNSFTVSICRPKRRLAKIAWIKRTKISSICFCSLRAKRISTIRWDFKVQYGTNALFTWNSQGIFGWWLLYYEVPLVKETKSRNPCAVLALFCCAEIFCSKSVRFSALMLLEYNEWSHLSTSLVDGRVLVRHLHK